MTNSRNKGAAGERELSHFLNEHGFETRRGQQYCGANGDADVVGIDGLHIECKRVEKLNVEKALQQASSDKKENEIPAVMHRANRQDWKCTLWLDDFLKIWKKAKEGK